MPALIASTAGIAVAAIVNAVSPARAFLLLFAISCFGPMFTWLTVFITHLAFRRKHLADTLAFRMWGYPWLTLAGATLMAAALLTTPFTQAFRPTLLFGLPFLAILTAAFYTRQKASS